MKNYKVSHCVGILPIVMKDGSANNFSMRLELYDYVNKGIFAKVIYDISVVKNEYDPSLKDIPILSGIFNTRNGLFTIYINSSGKQKLENFKDERGFKLN
jgi:hypothetical protein